MPRTLVLAYYFPPVGGAGAQRPAKFVRYLPALGHEPVVVTGPGHVVNRWTPPDPTLVFGDDASLVHRVPGPEPRTRTDWTGRARRWLGFGSEWSDWWIRGAVDVGSRLDGIDLVYAWMSPYESAEAAMQLAQKLDVPWIADLGDPWALDEMLVFPTGLHRRRAYERMRRALNSAAAIIMSTPDAAEKVRSTFPELRLKPIVSIPNGFDASDFEGEVPVRDDGVFRIVHTGYLHTELGRQMRRTAWLHRALGGESGRVDILTRSHVFLLEAVEELLQRRPELRSRIEVHLAGVLSEGDREVAARSEAVRLHGYLPHAESIALVRSADLLFLPMQNLPPGRRSSTVPGKTYEYIASGRPILAAVPEGDAHDIIEAAGGNYLCRPDDVGGMVDAIERAVDNGTVERDEAALSRFEYQTLAGQVGQVFSRVVKLHRPPAPKPEQAAPGPPPKRTVLHLAYFFPPIGGAGAQRSLKFVRYLPFFGYRSKVITGSGAVGGRWAPGDDTLTDEVREAAEVDRVPGPEPSGASGLARRAERWFRVPTSWSKWWIAGVLHVGQNDGPADAILASMSPYESAEAGERLATARETPWIAGLRDPWALDEMMVFPSAVHRWREMRHMRRTLGSAEAVVVTSEETVKQLRDAFPELRLKPIVSIPNGFDASDFEGEVPVRDDGVFRIVHTGYLHTELGRQQRRTAWLHRALGGESGRVDILTRSHVFLLEAVEELLQRRPELRSRIEVHLAGVLSEGDREVAARSEAVRLHGYLPHAESIALVRSADLLFLPMQNLPPGRRSSTVPGKTYEYIASGRPILAAVPEGDAHDILEAVGTARFCRPGDSAQIADEILEQIDLWSRGDPLPKADPDVLQRFERRYLTAQLATLLDAVVTLREPLTVGAESEAGSLPEKLYAT